MGTAIKHPMPGRVKPSFVIFDIRALWRSGLSVRVPGPDVKNYKWQLNPAWHRMLYSCTHVAPLGVKRLILIGLLFVLALWWPVEISLNASADYWDWAIARLHILAKMNSKQNFYSVSSSSLLQMVKWSATLTVTCIHFHLNDRLKVFLQIRFSVL